MLVSSSGILYKIEENSRFVIAESSKVLAGQQLGKFSPAGWISQLLYKKMHDQREKIS